MSVFRIIVLFNRRRYVQTVIRPVALDPVMKDTRAGKTEKTEDTYHVIFSTNVRPVRRPYYDARRNPKITSADTTPVSLADSM